MSNPFYADVVLDIRTKESMGISPAEVQKLKELERDKMARQRPDGLYVMTFPEDVCLTESEKERIFQDWEYVWNNAPPKLVIIPEGGNLEGPLPGRYAFREIWGDHSLTTTFQTLEELKEYMREAK